MSDTDDDLRTTPLTALHEKNGAKMTGFAGYRMPVQYQAGVLKEHLHTRDAASLFDVSHMGQARLTGGDAAAALEKLVPADLAELPAGRMCYTQLTMPEGGILDDLVVTRAADHLYLVVNAGRKEEDYAHLRAHLQGDAQLEPIEEHAMLALQGPKAVQVLADLTPAARHMLFRSGSMLHINEIPCFVTRSGYTGEDGFEISCPADDAEDLATLLHDEEHVRWAGLGARDSLRLEAGLCLYGQDIDETTTPVEASLAWSIGKRRREEGGFLGSDVILEQLRNGAARYRVGLKPEGRTPARAGTEIRDTSGKPIGRVTSGGFGPSLDAPIAMGYVDADYRDPDTEVVLVVRNKEIPAKVSKPPFIQLKYRRS